MTEESISFEDIVKANQELKKIGWITNKIIKEKKKEKVWSVS